MQIAKISYFYLEILGKYNLKKKNKFKFINKWFVNMVCVAQAVRVWTVRPEWPPTHR